MESAVGLPVRTKEGEQQIAPLYDRDFRREFLKATAQTPEQIRLMLAGWHERGVIDADEHAELIRVFGRERGAAA